MSRHIITAVICYIFTVTTATEQYQLEALDTHNELRFIHHSPPLNLSDDLNARAVQCAEYYAEKGTIDHSCPYKNGAGENLWAHWPGNVELVSAARTLTNGWYLEVSAYDYDSCKGAGHFTQLVWKSSKELGFGFGKFGGGKYLAGVALYSPAGNWVGDYQNNVLRP